MRTTNPPTNDTKRRSRVVTVIAAAVTAAATVFGVATAVGAVGLAPQDPSPLHEGGPVTDRVLVATGATPGHGRWRLLRSEDATGQECLGLEVGGQPSATGNDLTAIAESCGAPTGIGVGTLNGKGETIVWGRVPVNTAKLQVAARGRPVHVALPLAAQNAGRGNFVVSAIRARLDVSQDPVAEAYDAGGRRIAVASLPVPAARED